jgi:hypothetical protein
MHKKYNQLEKISHHEINHISNKNEENQQLKLNIHYIQQQIINMMSKNQRQIDECALLNEKIRLYTQLNDSHHQQQQQCSFHINLFSRRIVNLQQENNRLLINLQNSQTKAMMIISSHRNKVLKKENMYQINQSLSHRPLIVRDSPMRVRTHKTLEHYSIYVERLMKIIYQCVQWREKLAQMNQLYFVMSYALRINVILVLFVDKNRTNSSTNEIVINKK